MTVRTASAFSPGGISSFFEICDRTDEGKPLTDPNRIGARGGGFVIKKGVYTKVKASEAALTKIEVSINGKLTPEAETSRTVAETLLGYAGKQQQVNIDHMIEVPIGAGFGSSAGGALGTALALSDALGLKMTYNHLGRIAHAAEIKCKTGLGTVGPIMLGGCILTAEPGGPGIGIIDRLPLKPEYVVITGTYGPTTTKQVLASPKKRLEVNRWGKETLDLILEEPTVENFLLQSLEFAKKTGFMSDNTKRLVQFAEKAGAIGAAQNMVGEAVHAVASRKNAKNVVEAFKQALPSERVLMSEIDFQGARLMNS